MRKLIASINMTIDGYCDHTIMLPDEEIHRHYEELLYEGDAILYGRTTFQLMEFWRTFLENPSEEKSMNDFALAIDRIPKIVFSNTLKRVGWESAKLESRGLQDVVNELKQQSGNAIFVGSRSLIIQLMKLNLIDEYQLCVHPVVAGSGLSLFEGITDWTAFRLTKTKNFKGSAIVLYYEPAKSPA